MKKYLFIFIAIILGSCNSDDIDVPKKNEDTSMEVDYRVRFTTPTVYSDYLKHSDYNFGIMSLAHRNNNTQLFPKFKLKGFKGVVSALDKDFSKNTDPLGTPESTVEKSFGKEVNYTISGDDYPEKSYKLYAPKQIEIKSPFYKANPNEGVYIFLEDEIPLYWNSDPNNKNGVLVVLEYSKSGVLGDIKEGKAIKVVDLTEDDGYYVIKKDMFDDIPNLAFVDLSIARGDSKIVNRNGKSFHLTTSTICGMDFALVRDKSTVIIED